MPHGRHIYAKTYDMSKVTMCAYSQSDHALPHWKYVLQCCAKYPIINIPERKKMISIPKQVLQFIFTCII